jgi:diadenosine tetraphosphate (Ap4A) HIT family hydrolase
VTGREQVWLTIRAAVTVEQMTLSADCYTCAQEGKAGALPPRECIAADDHWRVAHALGTGLEGWLVLLPRRHITAISELNDAEAQSLGTWQVRLSQALQQVLGCQKTYIAQFAEAEGFSHVHFHVVPRAPDLPHELRGPGIFQMMQPDYPSVTEQRMDEIARELRDQLAQFTASEGGEPAA